MRWAMFGKTEELAKRVEKLEEKVEKLARGSVLHCGVCGGLCWGFESWLRGYKKRGQEKQGTVHVVVGKDLRYWGTSAFLDFEVGICEECAKLDVDYLKWKYGKRGEKK